MSKYKQIVADILELADVRLNGDRPWDPQIHDERFYRRVVLDQSLGLGESYMEGWWDCEQLDQLFCNLLRAHREIAASVKPNMAIVFDWFVSRMQNRQTKSRSRKAIRSHYDLGNDLFLSFLDRNNQYSCGYFKETNELDQAQINKMDLICKKLQLKKGDRLLDVGCGWGGLAKYAADNYDCEVTGIGLSTEQIKYAREFCKGSNVEIHNMDYRDLKFEQFDKIVAIEMFEHVGYKNYRVFMETMYNNLKNDGLFLLQTGGGHRTDKTGNLWMKKYIFPDGMGPSMTHIGTSTEMLFIMEDWHNLGLHYDKTAMAWLNNFRNSWPDLQPKFDEVFKRMWEYFLCSVAGAFRSRYIHSWQIVFSKNPLGQEEVRIS